MYQFMFIISIMNRFIFIALIFAASGFFVSQLYAAPLEGGYPLAPKATASSQEKARAYQNARIKVIEASKKYEGVPYRYGGMTMNGVDCSGFIDLCFKDAIGVVLPRSALALYTWAERIPLDKAQPGDLVFFKTDNSGNVTHVGLYLGDRRFIHAASAGSKTGVIYSSLNEDYYIKCFASAGRAFPEAPSGFKVGDSLAQSASGESGSKTGAEKQKKQPSASSSGSVKFLAGAAFAPMWNIYLKDEKVIRGYTSQFFGGIDAPILGSHMIFSLALRPEYDTAMGVFRLPITLSWWPNEKIGIFAGPVVSFGSASISNEHEERLYSKGPVSWHGTIGVTAAPFILKTKAGEFAPYAEASWQSYFSKNESSDFAADFFAGFRLSTGIKWMYRFK